MKSEGVSVVGESDKPVVVIGAGIAGLSCANHLLRRNIHAVVLEKESSVGGRVRTSSIDGYRLDHGFQVFQTAYPEAKDLLDYNALDLISLEPGALIRKSGNWVRMSDPLRRPRHAFTTMFNSIGGLRDRVQLLKLQMSLRSKTIEDLLGDEGDKSTDQFLREDCHFSDEFIHYFMRPWLSGIFLEAKLTTSANYFRFVFKMLAAGEISYPRKGIQAIPDQLASRLDAQDIRLNTAVKRIDGNAVLLTSGEVIRARQIVVAADRETARALIGGVSEFEESVNHQADGDGIGVAGRLAQQGMYSATQCIYFSADVAPVSEATLMLNGDGEGPINHVFVMTNAAPELGPPGKVLISVSVIGDQALNAIDQSVLLDQMQGWFGEQVFAWKELKRFVIPNALPVQNAGFYSGVSGCSELSESLICCGDYLETTSVNGAMQSGRLAAEIVGKR